VIGDIGRPNESADLFSDVAVAEASLIPINE
jgi:hypothetical protein